MNYPDLSPRIKISFMFRSSLLGFTDTRSAVEVSIMLAILVTASQVPHMLFARQSVAMFLVDHGYDTVVMITGAIIITNM